VLFRSISLAGNADGKVTSSPTGVDCGERCSVFIDKAAPVTLTATPSSDADFGGWGGICTGTGSCQFTPTTDRALIAYFWKKSYAVAVTRSGNGSGVVTSSPNGINCGFACNAGYAIGTTVTLTATPAADSTFVGWSGDCSGVGSCVVTMDATRNVSANFSLKTATASRESSSSEGVSTSSSLTVTRTLSAVEDPLTGSRYALLQSVPTSTNENIRWTLQYQPRSGSVYMDVPIAQTSLIPWRHTDARTALLPTTAWLRVCSGQVWTINDGYEMIMNVAGVGVVDRLTRAMRVKSDGEGTLLQELRCDAGGAVAIEGYVFPVSKYDPALSLFKAPAERFRFVVSPQGELIRRELIREDFDIINMCGQRVDEQRGFCDAARGVLQW